MKRYLPGMLVVGAMTAATIAGATPAWSNEQACGLGADPPWGSIAGAGSRDQCSGTVTLTVAIYKVRKAWPDKNVGQSQSTNFSNGTLVAYGSCDGAGTYYVKTSSSTGNSIESGRVGLC